MAELLIKKNFYILESKTGDVFFNKQTLLPVKIMTSDVAYMGGRLVDKIHYLNIEYNGLNMPINYLELYKIDNESTVKQTIQLDEDGRILTYKNSNGNWYDSKILSSECVHRFPWAQFSSFIRTIHNTLTFIFNNPLINDILAELDVLQFICKQQLKD